MAHSGDVSAELLRAEYERASEFCIHVDDVRNVITSFFLTLSAGAAVVLSKYGSGSLRTDKIGPPTVFAACTCLGIAVVGGLFVATLARLRRVQLERYRTMNAILDNCLAPEHRAIVPFSNASLAVKSSPHGLSRRTTGSYMWTLVIIAPTSMLVGLSGLIAASSFPVDAGLRAILSLLLALFCGAGLDRLYMTWSESA